MISLKGLLHFWEETATDEPLFIMTTMYRRFKGKANHHWHCMPILDKTRMGILVRKWVSQKLKRMNKIKGLTSGPFFWNSNRECGRMSDYNKGFRLIIGSVKERYPRIIQRDATP